VFSWCLQVCSELYGDDASSLEVTLCNAVQLQLSALSLGPPTQPILSQAQQQVGSAPSGLRVKVLQEEYDTVSSAWQLPFPANAMLSWRQDTI
jgi:hypothetical protein